MRRRALVEEEEGVDEIECKVFIKRSDSNLLWICREPALWDGRVLRGYGTHEEAEELKLTSRRLAAASDKLSADYQGKQRERSSERKTERAISRHPDSAAGSSQSESNQNLRSPDNKNKLL